MVVPDYGAFHIREGSVYRWSANWNRYVYDPTSRLCLNCLAVVEIPVDVNCPLCGYTDGQVWEEAG